MKAFGRSALLGVLACTAAGAFSAYHGYADDSLDELCAGYQIEKALRQQGDGTYSVDPARLNYNVLFHYRQERAASVDFFSDYALAATSMKIPAKIWWTLRKKSEKLEEAFREVNQAFPCARALFNLSSRNLFEYAEGEKPWVPLETEIAQIENLPVSDDVRHRLLDLYYAGKIGLEGDLNPIRVAEMRKMFEQVLYEEWRDSGIEPTYGEEHKWSREFTSKYAVRFTPISQFSKLLIALSRGVSDVYMITEKESDLRRFILEQPLRGSVEPYGGLTLDRLFRESYRLNGGDVYRTLLTIENVLAIQWRDPNRETLASTLRLRSIINYFGNGADHYGSWYHLFGIMLYGYTKTLASAKFVAHMESVGSHILFAFENETQEDHMNSKGANLGTLLRKIVRKRTYLKGPHDPGFLVPEYYLNLNEDFTARLLKLSRKLERKQ